MPDRTAIIVSALLLVFIIAIAAVTYVYFVLPVTNSNTTPPTSTPTPRPTSTSLPKPRISTDVNWGGYAVATNFTSPQPVITQVSASWTVPSVNASVTDTFSAIWVGIGGTFTTSLIQVGSEQDYVSGQPTYFAWYEMLPGLSTPIYTVNISPGDRVTASITLVDSATDLWEIYIGDLSSGESFNQTFTYATSRYSADWIVERPTVNGNLASLADFGQITMSNCTVTVNGVSGRLADFNYVQTLLVNSQRTPLVDISDIGGDKSSFTVSYLQNL